MCIVSDKLLWHGNGPGNRNDVECVLVCIKRPIRRQIQLQMQLQMHKAETTAAAGLEAV